MSEQKTIFSFSVLGMYNKLMYGTLLYPHHLTTKTPKLIEWKTKYSPTRGYLLVKENRKYFYLQYDETGANKKEDNIDKLPIRVNSYDETDAKNNDVVCFIDDYRSFRVEPKQDYTFPQLIHIDNIQHSNPMAWTLWKIVCHAARYSKINIRVAGVSEFGKSSYFKVLNYLLSKCYVISKPRTVGALCLGITSEGVLVVDETAGDIESSHKRAISNILYQYGDMDNELKSGSAGSPAHNIKARYDISKASCVVLYNYIENYGDKSKYFDYMFLNSPAINNRFLPLKLSEGTLSIDQFSEVKYSKLEEKDKELFNAYMRSAEYVRVNWKKEVDMDYIYSSMNNNNLTNLTGRQRNSFIEICCFIYLYATQQTEEGVDDVYGGLLKLLYSWYTGYGDMIKENTRVSSDELISDDFEEIKMT